MKENVSIKASAQIEERCFNIKVMLMVTNNGNAIIANTPHISGGLKNKGTIYLLTPKNNR